MIETIEINGVKYAPITKQASSKSSKSLLRIMAIASMFANINGVAGSERKRPNVNLAEEFELIQNKKSKLSRSDREYVVYCFNKNYQIIPE